MFGLLRAEGANLAGNLLPGPYEVQWLTDSAFRLINSVIGSPSLN